MPETFLAGVDLSLTPALGFRRPQGSTEAASRSYVDAPPLTVITGAVTFALAAAGSTIEYNSTSAASLVVPPFASVPFEVGSLIRVRQTGTGKPSIAGGSGVTVNVPGGSATGPRVQWSTVTLENRGTNLWVLSDDVG